MIIPKRRAEVCYTASLFHYVMHSDIREVYGLRSVSVTAVGEGNDAKHSGRTAQMFFFFAHTTACTSATAASNADHDGSGFVLEHRVLFRGTRTLLLHASQLWQRCEVLRRWSMVYGETEKEPRMLIRFIQPESDK